MDQDNLPYRPCVGVMVLNRNGQVWIGRRADKPNKEMAGGWWQMPQGGIDEGEEPRDAALRELYEETGIRSATIVAESRHWHAYDLPAHLVGRIWGGRYRGQTQRWFAVMFTGDDAEINLAPDGHDAEFDQWRWAPVSDLLDLIVPFKRDVYFCVIEEFRQLAASGD
ncbi:MAG: RNA pyrophosphohydrolase [Hyphomicrobiaceae bacterium]